MRVRRTSQIKFLNLSLACRRERAQPWDCFHQHNEVELIFVREGTLTYRFSGELKTIRAEGILSFWSSIPHQIVASERPPFIEWATVPLGLFLQWRLPEPFSRSILTGRMVVSQQSLPCDRHSFIQWEKDLAAKDKAFSEVVKLELESRFRRMALAYREDGRVGCRQSASVSKSDLGRIEKSNMFIAANFERKIGLTQIAKAAGVHPNYLVTLYRRQCGSGPTAFVTALRVAKAQRLLATSDLKIGAIAFDAGFGSVNAFYQAFWKACRATPSEYRALHAASAR